MSRCPLVIRDAAEPDVDSLRELMSTLPSRQLEDCPHRDAAATVVKFAADPDHRLLVATHGEEMAGAVLLVRAPMTPIHSDGAMHVLYLHVRPEARRRGVGRALMEAAVSWAEETGASRLLAVAPAGARDTNRFLARLGLGPATVGRVAPVSALRAKLPVEPPAAARVGGRTHPGVGQLLAVRRSQRRARERFA